MKQYMSDIVGNDKLCEKLCKDVISGKLSHALIIEGAVGTGKHTIAKNIAAVLACQTDKGADRPFPCGTCAGCRKVLGGKSPDIISVGCDGKATLGVDAVRFLKEDVRSVPNDLDVKVYIIEDADKMTPQAQNALLLTLEEPPYFVHFLLLCEHSELLLETIRSRAPILRTEPISAEAIGEYLCRTDNRAAQMKLSSPKEFEELLLCSKNGIGRALELLDPKAFSPVKDMRTLAEELIREASDFKDPRKVLPLLSRFSQKRDILSKQLSCLSEAVNDLILLKKTENAPLRFFLDRDKALGLCDKSSVSFLYNFGEAVLTAIDSISRNANVRLTLIKLLCDAQLI